LSAHLVILLGIMLAPSWDCGLGPFYKWGKQGLLHG